MSWKKQLFGWVSIMDIEPLKCAVPSKRRIAFVLGKSHAQSRPFAKSFRDVVLRGVEGETMSVNCRLVLPVILWSVANFDFGSTVPGRSPSAKGFFYYRTFANAFGTGLTIAIIQVATHNTVCWPCLFEKIFQVDRFQFCLTPEFNKRVQKITKWCYTVYY